MEWLKEFFTPKITIQRLLREYKDPHKLYCPVDSSQILRFDGLDKGYTVYNITPPFEYKDREYIFGRVENPDDPNTGSEVWIFKKRGVVWDATDIRIKNLEDPFYTKVNGEIIFGGVRIDLHCYKSEKSYYTVFWKLNSWKEISKLDESEPFLIGPKRHKDIRLVELGDGVGLFTRPQGDVGGRGIICFKKISSINEFTEETIHSAEPIEDFEYLFDKRTVWGGVNDATRIGHSSKLFVIGHLAYGTDLNGNIIEGGDIRHYHGFSFIFDTDSRKVNNAKIILLRENLPSSAVKTEKNRHKDDLKDVVFIGGSRLGERPGLIKIYGGASDSAGFYTVIEDPYYEKMAM
jgi:hypothetical protein